MRTCIGAHMYIQYHGRARQAAFKICIDAWLRIDLCYCVITENY